MFMKKTILSLLILLSFVSFIIGQQNNNIIYSVEGNFICGNTVGVCFSVQCGEVLLNCPLTVEAACQGIVVTSQAQNGCVSLILNNSIPRECCENGYIEFLVTPDCSNSPINYPPNCLQSYIVRIPYECCPEEECIDQCYWKLGGNDQSIIVDNNSQPTNNILGTLSPYDIRIFTAGTEKAILKTDGKLGIGTNAPTDLVDINGTLRVRNLPTKTNDDALLFATSTGSNIGVLRKLGTSATKTKKFLNENGSWEESADWHTDGNTISGNEFIGTINEKDFIIKVFNSEIARYRTKGNYSFGTGSIDANSYNSAIFGIGNSILNSTKSYGMGEGNILNNTNECVSFGENNTTVNSHGSFIGGAHSSISNAGTVSHSNNLVNYNSSVGYYNAISGINYPAGSNTNAGQFNSIIANDGGAQANGNYGSSNSIQSSNSCSNSGVSNSIIKSEESHLFGKSNSISYSEKTTSVGSNNSITSAFGSNIWGRLNTITNSNNASALGLSGSLTDANNAFLAGNSNSISTSTESFSIGNTNSIIESNNAFVYGNTNQILNNSNFSNVIGNNNQINNSIVSHSYGNTNRILNSNNSFVVGSNARVNAINSVTIGHFTPGIANINSANNSIKLGINQNTATITARGVSIQIDPTNPSYVPSYNLEVEASGNPNGSNISFQNLPQAAQFPTLPFETVVIDPTTGELFRTALCCPIMLSPEQNMMIGGKELEPKDELYSLRTKLENLEQENEKLFSLLKLYDDKFALLEKSITELCENGCEGMNNSNKELNSSVPILYQSIPNPTNNLALINYYLVSDRTDAEIHIFTNEGKLMNKFILSKVIGYNSIKVNLENYSSGVYRYSLIVDNKNISSKNMQIIK